MTAILFVCTANKLRSPTAERVFAAYPGITAASAGLDPSAERVIDADMVQAADLIFVMDQAHRSKLRRRFKSALGKRPVIVLGIPDEYERDQPELVALLIERVTPHLDEILMQPPKTSPDRDPG
jgi:predicted protein tyrosine phosphatase